MGSKKKTKLSGIMDNSSMGISLGSAEMEISKAVALSLRKEMRKHKDFYASTESLHNDGIYILTVDDTKVIYEFKKQGNNLFLNVSGNPTKLMTGSNSVPVLLKNGEFEGNAVFNTFKYANRIMYALLDYIPGFDFTWSGKERQRLEEGDFNGSRLQYAWYSGDLISKEQRTEVLRFIKLCYGGQDASKESVSNLAQGYGLNYTAWDANKFSKSTGVVFPNDNITIAGQVGDKKDFSITLYAKDDEMKNVEGSQRFQTLIRFDSTFNDYFLRLHNIKRVADLEAKYFELCEADGYDVGFVKWLAQTIHDRLKFVYILTLTRDVLKERMDKCEEYLATTAKKEAPVVKLLNHWMTYGTHYGTLASKCEALNLRAQHYAKYKARCLELTGIDIDISRSSHEALLDNRTAATRSMEERSDDLFENDNSNKRLRQSEKSGRDKVMSEKVSKLILRDGSINLRRLKPIIITSNGFWVYKKLREAA